MTPSNKSRVRFRGSFQLAGGWAVLTLPCSKPKTVFQAFAPWHSATEWNAHQMLLICALLGKLLNYATQGGR